MVKDTASANDRALELLQLTTPPTVLEVGFGQGRTVELLLRRGHRVIGVDRSSTMVRQAAARNRAACRDGRAVLRGGDGVAVPFPDDEADAAVTVHTIYFMPDPQATLAEIARVLRPASRLVIACRTSNTAAPAWIDPDVYRIPSASDLGTWLTGAGFTDVRHHRGDAPNPHTDMFVARTPG